MAREDDDNLKPKIEEPDEISVNVQTSRSKKRKYSQYFIQIPAVIVKEMNMKKGDLFIFKVPYEDKKDFSIKYKKKQDKE